VYLWISCGSKINRTAVLVWPGTNTGRVLWKMSSPFGTQVAQSLMAGFCEQGNELTSSIKRGRTAAELTSSMETVIIIIIIITS
jgi:hypothetical protein